MNKVKILAQVLLENDKLNALPIDEQLAFYKTFVEVIAETSDV